jgi:phosphate transport system permease protein
MWHMKILSILCILLIVYFVVSKVAIKLLKLKLFKKNLPQNFLYINSTSLSLLTSIWLGVSFLAMFIFFHSFYGHNKTLEFFIAGVVSLLFLLFTSLFIFRKIKNTKLINISSYVDGTTRIFMNIVVYVSISITIVTFCTLCIESLKFFKSVSVIDFLFGLRWYPDDYQFEGGRAFGFIPLLLGTMMIAILSILVAFPIGVFSAIYISEYADDKYSGILKSVLEVLSGVPTIVYGYFAAFVFSPFFVKFWHFIGFSVSFESAINASFVIGIMIIPYVASLCYDIFRAMPSHLRHYAFAMGITKYEMIKEVLIPYSKPKLFSVASLALSRALGETMIVVMSAGLMANLTFNPFESVTTITVQIAELLTGDSEFSSVKSLSAFALSFALFLTTLLISFISMVLSRRYEAKYGI